MKVILVSMLLSTSLLVLVNLDNHVKINAQPVSGNLQVDVNFDSLVEIQFDKIALCLSGGGYRAMLFHLGVLRRLNTIGALPHISRIGSVSGGSITAAQLALSWKTLESNTKNDVFVDFDEFVTEPLIVLAEKSIDLPSVFFGMVSPRSGGQQLSTALDKHLFSAAQIADLDKSQLPIDLTLYATELRTGLAWKFSPKGMGNGLYGYAPTGDLRLSVAVAASAGFPPFFAPLILDGTAVYEAVGDEVFLYDGGLDWQVTRDLDNRKIIAENIDRIPLADGGIVNNLGSDNCKHQHNAIISDASGFAKISKNTYKNWPDVLLRSLLISYEEKENLLNTRERNEEQKKQQRNSAISTSIQNDIEAIELRGNAGGFWPEDLIRRQNKEAFATDIKQMEEALESVSKRTVFYDVVQLSEPFFSRCSDKISLWRQWINDALEIKDIKPKLATALRKRIEDLNGKGCLKIAEYISLSNIPTNLREQDRATIEAIVNWGTISVEMLLLGKTIATAIWNNDVYSANYPFLPNMESRIELLDLP